MHEPFSLLVSVYDGDRPDYIRRAHAQRGRRPDRAPGPGGDRPGRAGPRGARRVPGGAASGQPGAGDLRPAASTTAAWGPRSTRGWRRASSTWSPAWTPTTWPCRTASRWSSRSSPRRTSSGPACWSSWRTPTTSSASGSRPPIRPRSGATPGCTTRSTTRPSSTGGSAVLAAGGYGDLPLMEDYALFARMLAGGARAVNVAEPLVFYRVGAKAFKRRGGPACCAPSCGCSASSGGAGFTTPAEFVRNVLDPRRLPAGPVVAAPRGVPPAGRALQQASRAPGAGRPEPAGLGARAATGARDARRRVLA